MSAFITISIIKLLVPIIRDMRVYWKYNDEFDSHFDCKDKMSESNEKIFGQCLFKGKTFTRLSI